MGGVREGTDFFPLTVDYEDACMPADESPLFLPARRQTQH
jgi:hypothetical protein